MSRIQDDEWLNAWAVSWIAHQLPRDPLNLFDANMFHPLEQSFTYTEPLVVPASSAPRPLARRLAILTHNLLVFAGLLLTAFAMYRLVVHWTGRSLERHPGRRAADIQHRDADAHRAHSVPAFLCAPPSRAGARSSANRRPGARCGVGRRLGARRSPDLGVSRRARRDHPRAAFVMRAGDWWGRHGVGIAARLGAAAAATELCSLS